MASTWALGKRQTVLVMSLLVSILWTAHLDPKPINLDVVSILSTHLAKQYRGNKVIGGKAKSKKQPFHEPTIQLQFH
jgi:hypothetical protein